MKNFISIMNNPFVNHPAISFEREQLKEQNKMNTLFKINIHKIKNKIKNKNFILTKDNQFVYQNN